MAHTIPISTNLATSHRRLTSYSEYAAAIIQGSRTRRFRELYESQINPQKSQNYQNSVEALQKDPVSSRNVFPVSPIPNEELPERDTVRKARMFFESGSYLNNAGSRFEAKNFLGSKSRQESSCKYNRHPLEKILVCSRSSPKLTVAGKDPEPEAVPSSSQKTFIYISGKSSMMRWPTFKEQKTSNVTTDGMRTKLHNAGGNRIVIGMGYSTRSGTVNGMGIGNRWISLDRGLRRSADTESSVSETSDWSSASSDYGSSDSSRHSLFDRDVEGRYVSPQVLRKIRSLGRSYTFVNGRMIDDKGNELESPSSTKIPSKVRRDSFCSYTTNSETSRCSSPFIYY